MRSYSYVENLQEFINSYTYIILPDTCGSGIKTRTVFCMKCGACIIATKIATEGIPVKANLDYIEIPDKFDNVWFDNLWLLKSEAIENFAKNSKVIANENYNNKSIDKKWINVFISNPQ